MGNIFYISCNYYGFFVAQKLIYSIEEDITMFKEIVVNKCMECLLNKSVVMLNDYVFRLE